MLLLHTPTLNTTPSDSQLPLAPHPSQGSPTTRSICQSAFSTTFVNKAIPGVLRIPLLFLPCRLNGSVSASPDSSPAAAHPLSHQTLIQLPSLTFPRS